MSNGFGVFWGSNVEDGDLGSRLEELLDRGGSNAAVASCHDDDLVGCKQTAKNS